MSNLFVIDNIGLIVPVGLVIALIVGTIQRYRENKLYGPAGKKDPRGAIGNIAGNSVFRQLPADITGASPSGEYTEPDFEFDEEAEARLEEEHEQNVVFKLIICDNELSYDEYDEEFFIGVFLTRKKALEVAAHYLNFVRGFKDYECAYRIDVIDVIGEGMFNSLYAITGWNLNEYGDEINIIESDFYISRRDAVEEFAELKRMYDREEWVLESYNIDECHWRDGFVRG